ncbi:MAG: ABC transporter ATP-binding protein [Campylobacteraceae bacterium]|jgi:putative ABC transport system ATP-binding protein|nr:ABC transporter ATP-binding protein [Campylobacteraceae bacterium]
MSIIVELKDIEKHFGDVKALDGVNIAVKSGEWVSIMGPSGSGKTTLLNILSLMDAPTSGEYLLEGIDASKLNEKEQLIFRREKIGLVFQQFHLIPYLSALENVMLSQYYHSATDEEDAKEALKKVGLFHRLTHRPSELSGGEQQRLCIARALINNPEILLADEPTGNLDEENERVVFELLGKLRDEGKTIIVITHNPELGYLGDRIIYIHHGKIEHNRSVYRQGKPHHHHDSSHEHNKNQ